MFTWHFSSPSYLLVTRKTWKAAIIVSFYRWRNWGLEKSLNVQADEWQLRHTSLPSGSKFQALVTIRCTIGNFKNNGVLVIGQIYTRTRVTFSSQWGSVHCNSIEKVPSLKSSEGWAQRNSVSSKLPFTSKQSYVSHFRVCLKNEAGINMATIPKYDL